MLGSFSELLDSILCRHICKLDQNSHKQLRRCFSWLLAKLQTISSSYLSLLYFLWGMVTWSILVYPPKRGFKVQSSLLLAWCLKHASVSMNFGLYFGETNAQHIAIKSTHVVWLYPPKKRAEGGSLHWGPRMCFFLQKSYQQCNLLGHENSPNYRIQIMKLQRFFWIFTSHLGRWSTFD